MPENRSRLMFSKDDYEVVDLVNSVLATQKQQRSLRILFDPFLHPRGIKEMAASRPLRLACAVFDLLGTIDEGYREERIRALRCVREEVLHNGSQTLRRNTARVLLQIMKALIRARGDERAQLELAHDFNEATSGNPRLIRAQLRKYHLLKMPEDWNQMAFDHHVHDANSTGRKSPTHLIMDAWVKGIRHLVVVYYQYVGTDAASELLEAAEIMDVEVRVGIEFSAPLRGKRVRLIWMPRGFHSRKGFLTFLNGEAARELTDAGQAVAKRREDALIERLERFNTLHLPTINEEFGLTVPELTTKSFLDFVGTGQTSLLHLSEFIHASVLPHIQARVKDLGAGCPEAKHDETHNIHELIRAMNLFVPETIAERYLTRESVDKRLEASTGSEGETLLEPPSGRAGDSSTAPASAPPEGDALLEDSRGSKGDALLEDSRGSKGGVLLEDSRGSKGDALLEDSRGSKGDALLEDSRGSGGGALPDPCQATEGEDLLAPSPGSGREGLPELLRLDLKGLLDKLVHMPCGYRIVLDPSGLAPEEVLEVLYDGEGRISHLEIFNLKDWAEGGACDREKIANIRQVINRGNVIECKRLVSEILQSVEKGSAPDREDRAAKIRHILHNIPKLQSSYRYSHLRSRIGSGSTGRSRVSQGMGLVVVPTLPWISRRWIGAGEHPLVPIRTMPRRRVTYVPLHSNGDSASRIYQFMYYLPLLRVFTYQRKVDWQPVANSTYLAKPGNIATLGGVPEEVDNCLLPEAPRKPEQEQPRLSWPYMNTGLKNFLKVFIGFIPAFLTFYLTKDWWLLAYFGAIIWFGITGLRNIGQSIVGGGGLVRSPLLKWNDFVSWGRVADSLLYTGFSVPLLDYLVKTMLLDRGLGITTSTDPIMLYTAIALANGLYISSHNAFRGLQLMAIVGNFFRTVLSIPIAVGLNFLLGWTASAAGLPAETIDPALQLWAAVISKTASDMVAAIIEGSADRRQNVALRLLDYREKQRHLYEVFSRLEMLFPEDNVLDKLEKPKKFVRTVQSEADELVRQVVINALDLMYFWMYQPRARKVFYRLLEQASPEERRVLLRSQRVLERKRFVSELLLGGLVGRKFDGALAFYLGRVEGYMEAMRRLEDKYC